MKQTHYRKMAIAIALGVMIIATPLILIGCGSSDIEPGVTVEDYLNGDTKYKFDNSIDEFLNQQGSKFGDLETTIATYYAEKEFEDIDSYRILDRTELLREGVIEYKLVLDYNETDYMSDNGSGRQVDWLGFGPEIVKDIQSNSFSEYPAEKLITDEVLSTEIFNEWVLPSIENYLNFAVKNPSGKERAVLENSFKKHCTFAAANPMSNSSSTFQIMSNGLINEINNIASKYSSNYNFTVKGIDLSNDGSDGRSTLNFNDKSSNFFNATPIYSSDDTDLEIELNPTICLEVTRFDENGKKTTELINESIQITLIQNGHGRLYLGTGSFN